MRPIFSGSQICIGLSALVLACIASPTQAARLLAFEPCLTVEEENFILQHVGQAPIVKGQAAHAAQVSYAAVDLNGDGVLEIAIRVSADGLCADRCRTTLFMKSGRSWLKMVETDVADIAIGERSQFGMRNLLVGDSVVVWTGRVYVAAH